MNDLLELIDPKWHDDFLSLVDKGEASDAFLKFLDEDEKCQEAVDKAMSKQFLELITPSKWYHMIHGTSVALGLIIGFFCGIMLMVIRLIG